MSNLKHQAVSGIKWSMVSQIGRLVAQFTTTIILSRLLEPSDFGLVAMAMVVVGFIGIIKELGTAAAVIQKEEISEKLLSSVFWMNVILGISATILLFFGAGLGGEFYHEPRIIPVLQILSVTFSISGLSVLHQALLSRALAFDTLAKIELVAILVGSVVGIYLAFNGYGVWSLVYQTLTTAVVTTVLLWFFCSWRPQLIYHWSEIKTVSSFSLNLTGYNIFGYFTRNADNLLIGRYLGAQDLGYYTLAYRILLFPIQNISAVIGKVMFPAYSTIQDDNRRFSEIFLRIASAIALITFPMMFGLLVLAEPFVLTLFGEQWRPIIILIMIFAFIGLSQSIGTTVGAIYQAKGRTDLMLRWGLGAGSFIICAFVVGMQWGLVGVAVSYAVAVGCLFYLNYSIPFKLIDLKFTNLLSVLWRSFFNSCVMCFAIFVFKSMLPVSFSNVVILGSSIIFGAVVYMAMSWVFNKKLLLELWGLISK